MLLLSHGRVSPSCIWRVRHACDAYACFELPKAGMTAATSQPCRLVADASEASLSPHLTLPLRVGAGEANGVWQYLWARGKQSRMYSKMRYEECEGFR